MPSVRPIAVALACAALVAVGAPIARAAVPSTSDGGLVVESTGSDDAATVKSDGVAMLMSSKLFTESFPYATAGRFLLLRGQANYRVTFTLDGSDSPLSLQSSISTVGMAFANPVRVRGTLETGSAAGSNITFGGRIALLGETTLRSATIQLGAAVQCVIGGCGEMTIDVSGADAPSRVDGVIGGAGALGGFDLVKAGAGTLILSAANQIGGSTIVQGGELRVLGSVGTGTSAGNVIVAPGGRLSGTGEVGGGPDGGMGLTVQGLLDLDGIDGPEAMDTSLFALDGGTLQVRIASRTSASLLRVADGDVSLSGGARLRVSAGAALADGARLVIIRKASAGPISGTFAGLPEGAKVKPATGDGFFRISYAGGDGNDVELTYGTKDDAPGFGGPSAGGVKITAPTIGADGVLVTRITAPRAGTLRQVATVAGGRAARVYCRATGIARRAGAVTLRCTPSKAARGIAAGTRLRVVTTFKPKRGSAVSKTTQTATVP
ncbi:MAG: autotransporter-associated beta strand repeat-containing protein [Gaiellales bacterium]